MKDYISPYKNQSEASPRNNRENRPARITSREFLIWTNFHAFQLIAEIRIQLDDRVTVDSERVTHINLCEYRNRLFSMSATRLQCLIRNVWDGLVPRLFPFRIVPKSPNYYRLSHDKCGCAGLKTGFVKNETSNKKNWKNHVMNRLIFQSKSAFLGFFLVFIKSKVVSLKTIQGKLQP